MTITRRALKQRLERDKSVQDVIDRIVQGMEKIIDGHLLLIREFPNQDHPAREKRQVAVIWEDNDNYSDRTVKRAIWAMVLEAIIKKYPDWNLELWPNRTSGYLEIIISYRESPSKRRNNIKKMFESNGHKLASWHKGSTKCINPGCKLDFHLRPSNNPKTDDSASIFVGSNNLQDMCPCPYDEHKERTDRMKMMEERFKYT